jgi:hypothetical protein
VDWIRHQSRRRMLPEVVIRRRARGDLNGLRHIAILADGYYLVLRRYRQGAGCSAGLELAGADLGARRVGFEI